MDKKEIPLEYGKYYHVFNRGNNAENLFDTEKNYWHFINLYEKYICPVAETYAWVLMRNHFHFLIKIKDERDIGFYKFLNADRSIDPVRFKNEKWQTASERFNLSASAGPDSVKPNDKIKKPNPTLHFSHLFNAYAKYFNIQYQRTGALFERPFQRIEITSEDYFRRLVIYIHKNPQNHGFINDFRAYRWSSYNAIISEKPTRTERQKVISWFDDRSNFIKVHELKSDIELPENICFE